MYIPTAPPQLPQGQSAQDYPTVNSAADWVGVHPGTLRRWIREGRLTAYRVGPRRLRIDPASLNDLVRRR